jgi:hypothetical protein
VAGRLALFWPDFPKSGITHNKAAAAIWKKKKCPGGSSYRRLFRTLFYWYTSQQGIFYHDKGVGFARVLSWL